MKWIAEITSAICAICCIVMAMRQTSSDASGGWGSGAFVFVIICVFFAQEMD